MFHIIDRLAVRRHPPANRGQRLRERPHDDVHFVRQAEMACGAVADAPKDAHRVRVIHENARAVAPGNLDDFRQARNVAFHRIHAVHDDQFPARAAFAHHAVEVVHVIVAELENLAEPEARTIDNRGMIRAVNEHVVAAPDKRRNRAKVRLESGGKHERRFFAAEFRQGALEFDMDVERSIEESRPGASRAVFAHGFEGRRFDARVIRQAHIRIRAEHEHPPASDQDFGVLRGFDHAKIRIQPGGGQFIGLAKLVALFEQGGQRAARAGFERA